MPAAPISGPESTVGGPFSSERPSGKVHPLGLEHFARCVREGDRQLRGVHASRNARRRSASGMRSASGAEQHLFVRSFRLPSSCQFFEGEDRLAGRITDRHVNGVALCHCFGDLEPL